MTNSTNINLSGLYAVKFKDGLKMNIHGEALSFSYINGGHADLIRDYTELEAKNYDISFGNQKLYTVLAADEDCAYQQREDELIDHGLSERSKLTIALSN
jgi:hypothetical protein